LPSFSRFARTRRIKQWQLKPFDLLQGPASDALQVAVEAGHRLGDAVYLFFALRPQPRHRLPLTVEVGLHIGKPLDRGLDPVPEPRTGRRSFPSWSAGLLITITGTGTNGGFAGGDLGLFLRQLGDNRQKPS
jgi:hypothetical protein